jgi:hypothetical protein
MTQHQLNRDAIARQRIENRQVLGAEDCKRSVLLAMLDHLPASGRQNIEYDIMHCANNDGLNDLAFHYITSIFRPSTCSTSPCPEEDTNLTF